MKLIFEGMEESGSVDLDKFIEKEKDQFFAGIDCMCISGESNRDNETRLRLGLIRSRQLLARHQDPKLDLRSSRYQLLRDQGLWTRQGSPLWSFRRNHSRANDRLDHAQ